MKKLKRDNMNQRYDAEINVLIKKSYVELVPPRDICSSERMWYLSHHAVISDKKPGKCIIMSDCTSEYKDKSLNDRGMQGPYLINNLLYVLLRFRLHEYAIQADVEAMYHAFFFDVNVRPDDNMKRR